MQLSKEMYEALWCRTVTLVTNFQSAPHNHQRFLYSVTKAPTANFNFLKNKAKPPWTLEDDIIQVQSNKWNKQALLFTICQSNMLQPRFGCQNIITDTQGNVRHTRIQLIKWNKNVYLKDSARTVSSLRHIISVSLGIFRWLLFWNLACFSISFCVSVLWVWKCFRCDLTIDENGSCRECFCDRVK